MTALQISGNTHTHTSNQNLNSTVCEYWINLQTGLWIDEGNAKENKQVIVRTGDRYLSMENEKQKESRSYMKEPKPVFVVQVKVKVEVSQSEH